MTVIEPSAPILKHDPERVLAAWCAEARLRESEHLQTARSYEVQHKRFRVLAFVLSTTVGTSLLASLSIPGFDLKILLGLLSFASALLSGLPNTLRSAELAADHQKASVKFGELRREIQQVRAIGAAPGQPIHEVISTFRQRFDLAVHESPTLRRSSIRFISKRSDDTRSTRPVGLQDDKPAREMPATAAGRSPELPTRQA